MFQVKKITCKMKSEESAIAQSDMLNQMKSVIDSGHEYDKKRKTWITWFTQEEWVDDKAEVETDE